MHHTRTLPSSSLARGALALLLALLLGLSLLPPTANAEPSAGTDALIDPPGNVQAAVVNDHIELTWDSVGNAERYSVYRSGSSTGPWDLLADNLTETSYEDHYNIFPDYPYYYYVTAFYGEAESAPSTIASVTWPAPVQTYPLTYVRNYTPEDAWFTPGGDFAEGDPVSPSSAASVGLLHDDYTRSGYRFLGWSTDRSATQGSMAAFNMPNAAVSLYAVWAPEFAVVYDGNGNDGGIVPADAAAYLENETVTVATDEPTRDGYTFAGWTADHDGKVYRAGDTFAMPKGGARLVANWTPKAAGPHDQNQAARPSAPANASAAGPLPKAGDGAAPLALALAALAALGSSGALVARRKAK